MSACRLEVLEWMAAPAVLRLPEQWDNASDLIDGACDWEFGLVVVSNETSPADQVVVNHLAENFLVETL